MRASVLGLSRDNFLITLSMFFWASGEGLWFYIQPLYIKSLGANPLQIGFVLSVTPILMLFAFIPAGILADRYGRRKIILGGYMAGTVAVLLLAFAQNWRQSILGFLLYHSSAFCLPAIHAYVSRASEGRDLNRTFTVVYAGHSLGLTIFPAVGGWLGEVAGFGVVFLLSGVFLALSTFIVICVREQPVTRASSHFGVHEILSNKRQLLVSLLFVPTFLALYLGQPFAPNYLQEVMGIQLFWIGFLGSIHALGATILSVWLGRLSKGSGGFIVGQGLVFLSLLLFLKFQAIPLLALSFFLRGAYNAVRSLAMARTGKMLGVAGVGLAFGIFNTGYFLSSVLAPYLAGWLYTSRPDLPFLVSAVMILVMMALSFALVREDAG
jgi:DHA1 family multidrug resistance protein-like MFS transporter